MSPKKGASETFGTDVLFGSLQRHYSTEIRSEDIILFTRKFPIWTCQTFIHDLDINNRVKL